MKLESLSLAVLALCLAGAAEASKGSRGTDALYRACDTAYSKYTFECPAKLKKNACTCNSPEYLASWMDCVTKNNRPRDEVLRAYDTLITICQTSGKNNELTPDSLEQIYRNATDGGYFIPAKNISKPKNTTVYSPLTVKTETLQLTYHSWKQSYYNKYVGKLYGGLLNAYFGLVLLIGALVNFTKWVAPGVTNKCNGKLSKFVRSKIANPASYGYRHATPLTKLFGVVNMAIPTRPQSLVLIGYGVMHFILWFIKHDFFEGNTRFPAIAQQVNRNLADRSGYFACYHLPLLFLFAGRNNIMLFLTGWSFETMNVYHRWVSRGMVFNAIIHACAFTNYEILKDDYPGIFSEDTYVIWGVVAVVCGAVVLITSHRFFRDKLHEVFLAFHWVFVALFLAGAWLHLVGAKLGYELAYAGAAIWCFDRFARLVRMVISGLNAKAHIQLYPHNVMKFKIDYSNWYDIPAGAHVFVTMLPFLWQSHPYSIYRSPVPGEEKKMVLAIRKREGMTKSLAHKLAKLPNGYTTMPILLDGPYGPRVPLANYQTVVFIAGGIGATATYGYLDGLKRAGRGEKQRLIFIWFVRSTLELEWFKEELDYMTADPSIEVRIYITNQGQADPHIVTPSDLEGEAVAEKVAAKNHLGDSSGDSTHNEYNVSYAKPDLHELVSNYVDEAEGTLAFMVCGPASLNDTARASVTENIPRGKARVEYFEESFAW